MAKAYQREKLEGLCRYVSRPAVSEKRLRLTCDGRVRYELKTRYRNDTTHVIFEQNDVQEEQLASSNGVKSGR